MAGFSRLRKYLRGSYSSALRLVLLAVCLAVLPRQGTAISNLRMNIGDAVGEGWRARNIAVILSLPAQKPVAAQVVIERIDVAEAIGPLKNVSVSCRNPLVKPPEFQCRNGKVSGVLGQIGLQRFTADVSYNSVSESLTFQLRGLQLAGGAIQVEGHSVPQGWQVRVASKALDLPALVSFAKPWFSLPKDLTVAGKVSLQLAARGGEAVDSMEAVVSVEKLTANNTAGTVATEALSFEMDTRLRAVGEDWDIEAKFRSLGGQAYGDPIFADLTQNPLRAQVGGRWRAADRGLQISQLSFEHEGIATGSVTGELNFGTAPLVRTAQLQLDSLKFPGAYATLMQPFLLNTEFKDLTTAGQISGKVSVANNAPMSLDLTLDAVTADDKEGKLGIKGLRGRVVWSSSLLIAAATPAEQTNAAVASHIAWDSAHAYGLSGGAARIDFAAAGMGFDVLKPTLIPILDGGLAIQRLDIREFGTETMSLRFEAQIQPISVPLLCKAFGWPEFSGTVSGRIPEVSYDNKVLSVGGALEMEAFSGRLTVDGLKLRDPLSDYPRLNADVKMRGLDLQAVTGTFSFGTITGKLDGEIGNLELFRWSPVRMDLKLYTPPNDKSRHLISQRAVNDLSNIGGGGGGVTAALSSGFLRFFENFRYQRLGLSCRLENEVCVMDGIERAPGNAYYLVKGSGVPRIDIIGNNRRIDWPRLLEQIKAVQASEGPVVQ